MEELAHPAATAELARSVQAWRFLVSWASVLFGLLIQIIRGTLSVSQILSFFRLRQSLVFSATVGDGESPAYRPLAVIEAVSDESRDSTGEDEERMERLTIVLDLDETLVCAYDTSSLPAIVRKQAVEAGLKCFDLECLSSEIDAEGNKKVNSVTVFERPGLREFLQRSSEFADLVLFTAGLEDYARPVVDKIDVDKKLSNRLYRPATVSTQYREHVKDLSCLSKDIRRVVIVDNNPFSFLLQPANGIPCIPFTAGQPSDHQLTEVILPLLKQLSLEKDVRTVLHEKYRMSEWFDQRGFTNPHALIEV